VEVSGQLHASATLSPGKETRMGGPQIRSGCGGEEKNSQPPPGLETPIIQRYTTELSPLLKRMYVQYMNINT